ncbi:hypothetical protein [Cupriavidus sp. EM10]|uniref:hypothetical protein n=1 Tax=Cupriavidus sp. EM10 TaxID=2839983 RepID=UPI001C0011C1|nr:hypothetical protein [Cupriavidus sp. EM10]QWE98155.1 hypothetical protein KLP38_28545 [Cupriavidus sp. EM10]
MNVDINADSLHRTVKWLVDSDSVGSFEEAQRIAEGFRLHLHIDQADSVANQSAALAVVTLGRRAFLGGVSVSGALDSAMHGSLADERTLGEALLASGALLGAPSEDVPTITIGGPQERLGDFHVRLMMAGWRAGVCPIEEAECPESSDGYVMPLAAVASAALAVSQAFSYVAGDVVSGREPIGLSLWATEAMEWTLPAVDGPMLQWLPASAWLLGLGHLGQAYAWCLSLLPYPTLDAPRAHFLLQDVDAAGSSTESTSVLTSVGHKRKMKTRIVADWLERRGFSTRIVERQFDAQTRRALGEPPLLFCGVDNPEARRLLDVVNPAFIVEAGLGSRHDDFQSTRLHTFPASRTVAQTWAGAGLQSAPSITGAYASLLQNGRLDQCGVVELAGKAVGAAFVGAFTAALAVSQVLKVLHGGSPSEVMDIDMRSLPTRTVVESPKRSASINFGYVKAAAL